MYATKPTRYFIEWESHSLYELQRRNAEMDGSYSPDHDDWYDPADIQVSEDVTGAIEEVREEAKEIAAMRSLFDQASIMERVGIHQTGDGFWDYRETREVETVFAP